MGDYILMVDDDWFLGDIVVAALKKRGWTVLLATTGEQALTLARKSAPTLVLLDTGLPDNSGWLLLRQLREEVLDAETPVVIVSAFPITRTQLRTHRVAAYLPKPFSVNRLLELIHAQVQQSRPRMESAAVRWRALSPEAQAILQAVEAGGVPAFVTPNLKRIAEEHGVSVADDDTPNEIIARLRALG